MNIIDFLIIVVIIIIIIIIIKTNSIIETENLSFDDDSEYKIDSSDIVNYDPNSMSNYKEKIYPYFMEMRFHQDYRDTLDAFNILVPDQKQIFNRSNIPVVTKYVSFDEVKDFIVKFINSVNKTIKDKVPIVMPLKNWNNELMPDPNMRSGWDKQQDELGLPSTLYSKAIKKAPLELIKVDKLEKYETDDEIRYIIFLIVKKKTARDQMLLKLSLVKDKKDVNLDREFFDSDKSEYRSPVRIEDVYVMGYFYPNSFGNKSVRDKFYDFPNAKVGAMNDAIMFDSLMKKKDQLMNNCFV
jgi:hypothetical protein